LRVQSTKGIVVHCITDHATAEAAFSVRFTHDGDTYHTTDHPILPSEAVAVVGLSNRAKPEAHVRIIDNPAPISASPGNDGLTPKQVSIAYGITGSNDGTGQTIAIAEWDGGYVQSDLDDFCDAQNLPRFTPNWVAVGALAQNNPAASSVTETTLDLCGRTLWHPARRLRFIMRPVAAVAAGRRWSSMC
jgi:hypothetical protein